jgi:hypothetical protein
MKQQRRGSVAGAPQLEKVSVVVRVRPPRDDGRLCVSAEGASTVVTHDSERQGKALRFHFSRAFVWDAPGASTTRDLYEVVGKHLLQQALSGYHCSLLAYGQTGAWASWPLSARLLESQGRGCGRGREAECFGPRSRELTPPWRPRCRQWQDAHPVWQRR